MYMQMSVAESSNKIYEMIACIVCVLAAHLCLCVCVCVCARACFRAPVFVCVCLCARSNVLPISSLRHSARVLDYRYVVLKEPGHRNSCFPVTVYISIMNLVAQSTQITRDVQT